MAQEGSNYERKIKNWSSKILLNCPFKRHRFTKKSLKRVLLHIASVFCQIWIRDRKLGSGSDYFFVKNNLVKEVAKICRKFDLIVYIIFLSSEFIKRLLLWLFEVFITYKQGWIFAHRFSERIARFLPKNERMSDLLKKMSNSLIPSFLVSDMSDSLTIAHFLWAMWAMWAMRFAHFSKKIFLIVY